MEVSTPSRIPDMCYIDHHDTLETLATHLVHEDCSHASADEGMGGHCYDCTLAHLEKMVTRIAVQVGTEYAYDHEHLAPDPAEVKKRLERMTLKVLGEKNNEK